MLNQSGKERLKLQNQAIDNLGHLFDLWEDRPTFENARFSERYLNGEFHILVRFRIRGVDKEVVACLQREEFVSGIEPKVNGGDFLVRPHFLKHFGHSAGQCGANVDAFELASSSYQESMFVDIVKSMDDPELVISTFVGLDFIDGIYGRLFHSVYLSHLSGFVFVGAIKDWEVNMSKRITSLGRDSSTIGADKDKLVGQMIQCTSEIVDDISETKRDVVGDGCVLGDVIMQTAGFRIALGRDFVGVGLDENLTSGLQLVDVLVGPFDFRPNKVGFLRHNNCLIGAAKDKERDDTLKRLLNVPPYPSKSKREEDRSQIAGGAPGIGPSPDRAK